MSLRTELIKFSNTLFSVCDVSSFGNPEQPSLALNMICKNNADTLVFPLESVRDVIDEIVIVDTGSSDSTLAVIEEKKDSGLPIKLIRDRQFRGYSYHRNQALAATQSDWILVLDSDEFISKGLALAIRYLIKTKIYSAYRLTMNWISPEFKVYKPNVCYTGRYKPWLKLFRRLPGLQYKGLMHEAVHGLETKRVKSLIDAVYSQEKPNMQESGVEEWRNHLPLDIAVAHLDTALNSFDLRLSKVLKRNIDFPGSAHPEEYLPELFNISKFKLSKPDYDFILKHTNYHIK